MSHHTKQFSLTTAPRIYYGFVEVDRVSNYAEYSYYLVYRSWQSTIHFYLVSFKNHFILTSFHNSV